MNMRDDLRTLTRIDCEASRAFTRHVCMKVIEVWLCNRWIAVGAGTHTHQYLLRKMRSEPVFIDGFTAETFRTGVATVTRVSRDDGVLQVSKEEQ